MCWNCTISNGLPCIEDIDNDKCLREYQEGNQIKLDSSHDVCPRCRNYRICPDPTVITMRNNI